VRVEHGKLLRQCVCPTSADIPLIDISKGMKMYKPKEIRIQPYEYHRVYLTDSLRYTGSIYVLLNQLHARILGTYFSPGFGPETQIIGAKLQFVSVKDYRNMEIKVH
jgi:hypothetical protein